jgi:hypothetical protein
MERGIAFEGERDGGELSGGDGKSGGMRWIHDLPVAIVIAGEKNLAGPVVFRSRATSAW